MRTKRICLFAGYSSDGSVSQYVLDYLAALSKHADIYYLADCNIHDSELLKIESIAKKAWAKRHFKRDIGSYSELAKNYVGWDVISTYDELIFANDSCFCLTGLESVFEAMDLEKSDFWGMHALDENNFNGMFTLQEYVKIPAQKIPNFCIGSYFIVFRKSIINDLDFREFVDSVKIEKNRLDVCIKYEFGLTRFLLNRGYTLNAFIKYIGEGASIYTEQALGFLRQGMPLLKIKIFTENPMEVLGQGNWANAVKRFIGNNKLHEYLSDLDYEKKYLPMHNRNVFKIKVKKNIKRITPPVIWQSLKKAKAVVKSIYRSIESGNSEGIKIAFEDKIWSRLLVFFSSYDKNQIKLVSKLKDSKELVVYFNLARDAIGGGMLSIDRFVENSSVLAKSNQFVVAMSGIPILNKAVEYKYFNSYLKMIDFSYIVKYTDPYRLVLNIPEVFLGEFVKELPLPYTQWLQARPYLRINIMNQNNDYMPLPSVLNKLRILTEDITITNAHHAYNTQSMADLYMCPVSLLTPFIPSFPRRDFSEKNKTIVVSPDNDIPKTSRTTKHEILSSLAKEFPDFKIIQVENMKLEDYKTLISTSLFTITFGEGYDGYFIEPYLSGSIAFSVYNDRFFPSGFNGEEVVFEDYDSLHLNIVHKLKFFMDNPDAYMRVQKKMENEILKFTNNKQSHLDLLKFYRREYSFCPKDFKIDGFRLI